MKIISQLLVIHITYCLLKCDLCQTHLCTVQMGVCLFLHILMSCTVHRHLLLNINVRYNAHILFRICFKL